MVISETVLLNSRVVGENEKSASTPEFAGKKSINQSFFNKQTKLMKKEL